MDMYEDELAKMAEWIVTHPPEIDPELVGSKLGDAEQAIPSYISFNERMAILGEKGAARRWLIEEALKRGYPGFGTGTQPSWEVSQTAKLKEFLEEEAKKEHDAVIEYQGFASIAEALNLNELASTLREIAKDEQRHEFVLRSRIGFLGRRIEDIRGR